MQFDTASKLTCGQIRIRLTLFGGDGDTHTQEKR